MSRKIRMGMVGGGRGAFIGGVHRMAAALDGQIELVCGAFSSSPEKSKKSGEELFLPPDRVYGSFEEMILKEKDFRKALKALDWSVYADKMVAIFCSADAIVPVWAYMLVATKLDGVAKNVIFGTQELAASFLFQETLKQVDVEKYRDKRVVIKGCGKKAVPPFAYVEIARLLKPVVKTLMYGEPCSTVPIYKQPRK